jgi:ADP-ribose pyrophosphatase YjhB (NUDIX family)
MPTKNIKKTPRKILLECTVFYTFASQKHKINVMEEPGAYTGERTSDPHFSVDCVLIGFDGERLCVLLVRRTDDGTDEVAYKLPGSLLYTGEELDDAAARVVEEMTGLKNVSLHQFRAFGSPNRLKDPKDVKWLTHFYSLEKQVDRVVTVAYTTLLKIQRKHRKLSNRYEACWIPIERVGSLAFDHNKILRVALQYIRNVASLRTDVLFHLLPAKFTLAQLRTLYQVVFNREYDVRNFHKYVAKMPFVVPLEEYEQGVAHRAARYYKFDRVLYNKSVK